MFSRAQEISFYGKNSLLTFCYNIVMQKIATKVFIYASLTFGVLGILFILTGTGPNRPDSALTEVLAKMVGVCVFVILPSFALSFAGRYLNGKF